MDRDQLLSLLAALNNDDVAVKPDGTVRDLENGDDWGIEDIEAAVEELTDELSALLEWAKNAPKRTPAATA